MEVAEDDPVPRGRVQWVPARVQHQGQQRPVRGLHRRCPASGAAGCGGGRLAVCCTGRGRGRAVHLDQRARARRDEAALLALLLQPPPACVMYIRSHTHIHHEQSADSTNSKYQSTNTYRCSACSRRAPAAPFPSPPRTPPPRSPAAPRPARAAVAARQRARRRVMADTAAARPAMAPIPPAAADGAVWVGGGKMPAPCCPRLAGALPLPPPPGRRDDADAGESAAGGMAPRALHNERRTTMAAALAFSVARPCARGWVSV